MSSLEVACAVCGQASNLKACSACGETFYCSVDHQKSHWKVHKKLCKPYQISVDPTLGRFVEATRDIKAGNVIFTESPLAIGPDWSYDLFESNGTLNCVGCFEQIKVLNFCCPKCKWPCCGPTCVGLDNPKLHDVECSLLQGGLGLKENSQKDIRGYFRSDALLTIKCLMLQLRYPEKFRELMKLESHSNERKTTANFVESEKLIDYLEKNFLFPLKEAELKAGKTILAHKDRNTLRKIHGIIETNAPYLTDDNQVAGLFAIGCNIEHSCIPNCHLLFDRKNMFKLTVKAARDIKKGEHISTCYTNILWGTQMRRQYLKEAKYFVCGCSRCADPTELGTHLSSLKCLGSDELPCEGGIQVPIYEGEKIEWACSKCPIRVSGDQVELLVDKIGEEIENYSNSTNVSEIEEFVGKLSNLLHPNHFHMFTLKHLLIQLYGNLPECSMEKISGPLLGKKLMLCNELLKTIKKLDPHNIRLSIYSAVVLLEKANSISESHRRLSDKVDNENEAFSCLSTAQKILENALFTVQGKQLNAKISFALDRLKNI